METCIRLLRSVYSPESRLFSIQSPVPFSNSKMLLPIVRRMFSARLLPRTKEFFVEFDVKNSPPCLQRFLCTAEKAENTTKSGEEHEASEELTDLDKKVKLLEEKDVLIKDLEDKYKRALAENENVKHRMQKQIEDTRLFGIQGFAKDLLEVADILEKATGTVAEEELAKNSHLKMLYEGLVMTDQQLHKVFNKNGLQKLNPMDEKFDPNFHEALFEQEVPGKQGTVFLVNQVGYTLNTRVLRPAVVGVAKAKS